MLTIFEKYFFLISILIFCLIVYPSLFLGLGEDPDSFEIYKNISMLAQGEYIRSRTSGFPLYEIPVSYIAFYFGILWANAYSLILTLMSLYIFYLLVKPYENYKYTFFLFAFYPLTLINSTIILETSQGIFFFLASIYFAKMFLTKRDNLSLAFLSLVIYMLIMTRLDYFIFGLILFFTLVINLIKEDKKVLVRVVMAFIFGIITVVLSYFFLNGSIDFISTTAANESLVRRFVRGILGFINLFTPIGVVLACWILLKEKIYRVKSKQSNFYFQIFIIALPLYLIRFIALPDEQEYIFPLYILFLLYLTTLNIGYLYYMLLTFFILLSNIVTISFFERKGLDDNLVISFKINKGKYLEDLEVRKFHLIVQQQSFISHIEDSVNSILYNEKIYISKRDSAYYITNKNDLILQKNLFYLIGNPRSPETVVDKYNRIILCDDVLYSKRGWRLLQPSLNYKKTIQKINKHDIFECSIVKDRP